MSSRRVPAALHRELSEYASLLRALRTRDTLDVTKHLTKPSPYDLSKPDDVETSSEGEMDEMLDKLSKPNNFSSALSSYSDNHSRSRSREHSRKKSIRRDHWTRWPLLLNDVLEPEWTLEDEVAVVASQALRAKSSPISLQGLSAEPEDDLVVLDMQSEDDDPDHAYYVPPLTCIISNYLSIILGQLASLTPPRPASMQNRIEPLNWRAVIDAVVSLGDSEYSDPKVLRTVVTRLEAIYGPSVEDGVSVGHRAIDRVKQIAASADRRHQQQETLLANVFDQASPSSSVCPIEPSFTKRKRKDKDDIEFVLRRRRIAKGKRPEGSKDSNEVVNRRPRSLRINPDTEDYPRYTSSRSPSQ